ncbi:C1 family peptidase [Deinococcus roseus]|uniref:Peptidase C1A papain C-terminal domain-containing protein n=1 Tax=Deinococcus roseus TaxID=392414 RepID=A0ABQ2D1A2_9DEIO|nr:C1 family peptidase [Deinococcus roseus]GGJ36557.1 hypothetical protein GCM10008938_23370 [Deinococcus roseus]
MAVKWTEADGTERILQGYLRSAPPKGTKTYDKKKSKVSRLPAKVDLRPHMTRIEDQGQTSSCTANATAGAYEYLLKRHQGEARDVSRLYMYYNGRYMRDPNNIQDSGVMISDVIQGLKEYGACTEKTWDFNIKNINKEPYQKAYDEGATFLIEETRMVPVDLEAWKSALAEGNPIIFGLALFRSFYNHKKPGVVPHPTRNEMSLAKHSGHAMLCVGYSDPDQMFIVRNSWGTNWGDRGYCYIPYAYIMNPNYNYGDSWIIERLEVLEPDEESWSEDQESVLPEVATVLSEMDDETYEALLEGMGEVPFEQRLALIFLTAVGMDGEMSEEELEIIKTHLAPVLEVTGGSPNTAGVLRAAKKRLGDDDLLNESIDLIWEYFDYDVLARITQQVEEAAAADGMARKERKFIDALIAKWQEGLEEAGEEEHEEEPEEAQEAAEGEDFVETLVDAAFDFFFGEDDGKGRK